MPGCYTLSDFDGGVLLDKVQAFNGDFCLIGPTAAEIALASGA
ncbi:MAG: hypothetical protein ACJAYE_003027 [Candidatus Azotimanducaceae bacterium]|jgi:hypothetical protein